MEKLITKIKALPKTDLAAVICFFLTFIYMFIFASFDGTISDEAFYISIPLRLIQGDGLFTDEWHLSQLSSVLLYPAVRIFTAVTGGTAGIVLFMRRLFVLFQLAVSIFSYKTLRKEGATALLISISFMLYSVIGLRALSYNTMGVGILLIICCILYSVSEKPSKIKMLITGSLIALFVLCQPFGVIFYALYFIAVIAFIVIGRKTRKTIYPLTVPSFLLTFAGILPVLAVFLIILLKNSDISLIIASIPGILSDPEHMEVNDNFGIETFSGLAFLSDMTMAAGFIPLIIAVLCIITALILKKRNRHLSVIIASAGLCLFILIFYIRFFFFGGDETDDINFFFFPLALSGLAFYLLQENKNHRVFIIFWCTGILYALFMTVSSNLRLHASVNGYIISSFGSLILAKDLMNELKNETEIRKTGRPAILLLAASVFSFFIFNIGASVSDEITTRAHYKSAKMTVGAYEGIRLPADQALMQTCLYNDVLKIKEKTEEGDRIFVVENLPSVYIDGEFPMGAFTGWFIAEELHFSETRDRFRNYYELNPDNIPEYVYAPAYIYGENGMTPYPPRMMASLALELFEGEKEDIGNGILIKVKGIKNEQN